MNEHIMIITIVAAAFLGPASALAVGLRWIERVMRERAHEVDRQLDEIKDSLLRLNGTVDCNRERLATVETRIRTLPCVGPRWIGKCDIDRAP